MTLPDALRSLAQHFGARVVVGGTHLHPSTRRIQMSRLIPDDLDFDTVPSSVFSEGFDYRIVDKGSEFDPASERYDISWSDPELIPAGYEPTAFGSMQEATAAVQSIEEDWLADASTRIVYPDDERVVQSVTINPGATGQTL